jgi:hypothetical protein
VLFHVSGFNVVVRFVATVSSHGLRSSTIIFVGLFSFFEIITRLLNGGLIPLTSSSPSPLFGAVWRERWDHNASFLHVLFCGYLNSVATVLLSSIFSSASSCSFITSRVDPWMVVRLLKVSSVQLMVRLSLAATHLSVQMRTIHFAHDAPTLRSSLRRSVVLHLR